VTQQSAKQPTYPSVAVPDQVKRSLQGSQNMRKQEPQFAKQNNNFIFQNDSDHEDADVHRLVKAEEAKQDYKAVYAHDDDEDI
jgi:hypothetical protein